MENGGWWAIYDFRFTIEGGESGRGPRSGLSFTARSWRFKTRFEWFSLVNLDSNRGSNEMRTGGSHMFMQMRKMITRRFY